MDRLGGRALSACNIIGGVAHVLPGVLGAPLTLRTRGFGRFRSNQNALQAS
jgi:hypothetical protein